MLVCSAFACRNPFLGSLSCAVASPLDPQPAGAPNSGKFRSLLCTGVLVLASLFLAYPAYMDMGGCGRMRRRMKQARIGAAEYDGMMPCTIHMGLRPPQNGTAHAARHAKAPAVEPASVWARVYPFEDVSSVSDVSRNLVEAEFARFRPGSRPPYVQRASAIRRSSAR